MEGTAFGHYRLLTLLGRGGMGEVWRAHDTTIDRIVAVKLLLPQLAQDKGFAERFRREARAVAQLNSPHIVPIHQHGEIDGQLYVDMRLIEGRDLAAVIADGPLEPARAVQIIEQTAKALHAVHKIGLIHRDVKPSNILLDEDDYAYLIDFGIARTTTEAGLTDTGAMIGSWHYMAPERMGANELDARSDVYSLACVLYETLTGQRPFPGERMESQVAAHLSMPPPRPTSTNPGLPSGLDAVIATGMAKQPEQRYQTTMQLGDAARNAMTAPQPHLTPRPQQRNGPGGAVNPAAATQQRRADPTPAIPASATQRHSRRKAVLIPAAITLVVAITIATIGLANHNSPPAVVPTFTLDGLYKLVADGTGTVNGVQVNDLHKRETQWAFRTACDENRCVAAGGMLDPDHPSAPPSLVRTADYVDGKWTTVSVAEGQACNGVSGEPDKAALWNISDITQIPESKLAFNTTFVFTEYCKSIDQITPTFTRMGDLPKNLYLPNPADAPNRVPSFPAAGFRGKYTVDYTPDGNNDYRDSDQMNVKTVCLRAEDRCVTTVIDVAPRDPGTPFALNVAEFESGEFKTNQTSQEVPCGDGRQARATGTATLPLPPAPVPDPIATLTGKQAITLTGGCSRTDAYNVTFTRTGD